MKVLHINTYQQAGGAEIIVNILFNSDENSTLAVGFPINIKKNKVYSLANNGIYNIIFSLLNKLKWRYRKHITFKNLFFLGEEFNNTYKTLSSLKAYAQADIIHLHNIHGGYFDLKSLMQIGKEKKIVWTLHDMWAFTGGEAYVFENINYKIGIGKTNYINVPPLNSPIIDRRQFYIKEKKRIYDQIAEQLTFVCVSDWLKECLLSSYVYSDKIPVHRIYNGYDTEIFYSHNSRKKQDISILIFNSDSPFKGGEDYKYILSKINIPFKLIVLGKDIEVNNKNIINKQYYNSIVDRNLLAEIYNKSDILIFNTKAEAFGLVPLEAMACGVCVFASRVGGLPEIIIHKETGYLYNSIQELNSLLNNHSKNKKDINKIGANAADYVRKKFNSNIMIKSYKELYLSLK